MDRELLKKNFENHGFKTSFFDSKEEATEYLVGAIKGKTVGYGGSQTLAAMDLIAKLEAENTIFKRKVDPEAEKKALTADIFISSANGVSLTGEIVNIDGHGNRVAGTIFGHEKVYFVVGKNKIAPDMASAVERAHNQAAPPNCKRLGKDTPCAQAGTCMDCNSPDRICCVTSIFERCMMAMEMEVVFIDEELGY